MRLNRFVASATGVSRRQADELIKNNRVVVDDRPGIIGETVSSDQAIKVDGALVSLPSSMTTIMVNKPVGVTVSRRGQGSKTIYDILPVTYSQLKPVGRLDKNSSGLLLMTDDGQLTQALTHPSRQKVKVYDIELNKPLDPTHQQQIINRKIILEDGPSGFAIEDLGKQRTKFKVIMSEGRNRQIRRTFERLGYQVISLNRIQLAEYILGDLAPGDFKSV